MAQAQARPGEPAATIVPEPARKGIALKVNGESFVHVGDPAMPLLWYLRDVLRLTGTKYGGDRSGVDLVLVEGKAVSAQSLPMSALAGKRVRTVEGLTGEAGALHPLQQAFIDEDAIGCGYCTGGWLIAAVELLARNAHPTDEDIDRLPVLCRCGCHTRVRRAIKRIAGAHA
ncbi:MAG: (2Fe-2S)-binding protein [Fulvimonas sp.]|nr:(2Fe-2S)-binding protein [Fulvimonas sp.]